MVMKIGIIGLGIVGDAVFTGLSNIGHRLCYYDIRHKHTSIDLILDTNIVYICVPTDSMPDSSCDTSIVEQVIDSLISKNYNGVIAIKSTVIPRTTERLISQYKNSKICFVPEFLRQKSAYSDFFDFHDVLVVGSCDQEVANTVISSHGQIPKNVCVVTPTEAEIVKYFNNVHNAMEIVFANSMHEMCKKLDADYQGVLNAVSKRSNINKKYLHCSEVYQGYGGKCLPKDTKAWAKLAEQLDVDVHIFKDIVEDNRRYLDENNSNR
jgi:UDPglucose 6-dehydrogenase